MNKESHKRQRKIDQYRDEVALYSRKLDEAKTKPDNYQSVLGIGAARFVCALLIGFDPLQFNTGKK